MLIIDLKSNKSPNTDNLLAQTESAKQRSCSCDVGPMLYGTAIYEMMEITMSPLLLNEVTKNKTFLANKTMSPFVC